MTSVLNHTGCQNTPIFKTVFNIGYNYITQGTLCCVNFSLAS